MADLVQPHSDAPRSSGASRRQARKAFGNSSFHWCLALLGGAAALALVPLWAPMLLASWMAVAFRPLHTKLARKIGGRSGAASVVTVLLVAAALLPLLVVGLSLVGTTVSLAKQLQKSDGVGEAFQSLFASPSSGVTEGAFDLKHIGGLIQSHGLDAWHAASLIFGAASAAVVGVFVFIYGFHTCLVDGGRAYEWLIDHSPLERWQTERLAAAYEETGRGLLICVGLTALLQGAVATVGYLLFGVPQALIFGLITALAALIPSIGTALVWVPLAIGLFVAGKTGVGAAVVGLGVVVSVADNFARPLLSRYAKLDLPAYLLFVAMLGGIVVFGAWGLLAGPLFVRLAIEALRLGRERKELGRSSDLLAS